MRKPSPSINAIYDRPPASLEVENAPTEPETIKLTKYPAGKPYFRKSRKCWYVTLPTVDGPRQLSLSTKKSEANMIWRAMLADLPQPLPPPRPKLTYTSRRKPGDQEATATLADHSTIKRAAPRRKQRQGLSRKEMKDLKAKLRDEIKRELLAEQNNQRSQPPAPIAEPSGEPMCSMLDVESRYRLVERVLLIVELIAPLRNGATLAEIHADVAGTIGAISQRTIIRDIKFLLTMGVVDRFRHQTRHWRYRWCGGSVRSVVLDRVASMFSDVRESIA